MFYKSNGACIWREETHIACVYSSLLLYPHIAFLMPQCAQNSSEPTMCWSLTALKAVTKVCVLYLKLSKQIHWQFESAWFVFEKWTYFKSKKKATGFWKAQMTKKSYHIIIFVTSLNQPVTYWTWCYRRKKEIGRSIVASVFFTQQCTYQDVKKKQLSCFFVVFPLLWSEQNIYMHVLVFCSWENV